MENNQIFNQVIKTFQLPICQDDHPKDELAGKIKPWLRQKAFKHEISAGSDPIKDFKIQSK